MAKVLNIFSNFFHKIVPNTHILSITSCILKKKFYLRDEGEGTQISFFVFRLM